MPIRLGSPLLRSEQQTWKVLVMFGKFLGRFWGGFGRYWGCAWDGWGRFWRGPGEVLRGSGAGVGDALVRCWRGSGAVLRMLEVFHECHYSGH